MLLPLIMSPPPRDQGRSRQQPKQVRDMPI
jgi:hypothetical protein